MRFVLLSIAVFFVLQPNHIYGQQLSGAEASAFQDAIRKQVEKTKTLVMDIVQVRVLKAFEDELTAKGIFYLAFPDRIRWETTSPYQSAIIYNKNQVAKYQKKDGKWQRLRFGGEDLMKQVMGQMSEWTAGEFTKSELYDVSFQKGERILLTPKSKHMRRSLRDIELKFDHSTYLISSVTINETGGDYVKISFSNAKINSPVSDRLFGLDALENGT